MYFNARLDRRVNYTKKMEGEKLRSHALSVSQILFLWKKIFLPPSILPFEKQFLFLSQVRTSFKVCSRFIFVRFFPEFLLMMKLAE
jgi:hypothetical protein